MAKAKYETHVKPYLETIKIWVAKGATQKEVAEKLHITRETLNQYRRKYADFSDALAISRDLADDQVEAALFRRCTGYDYEEVTRTQQMGRDGQLMWVEKRTQKHLPPDPNSIQFWLTNRRPKDWKRMPEVKETEADDTRGVIMMPEDKDG